VTPRQYKSLARYVRRVSNDLGLRDWTFDISHNPSDGVALAQIECIFGRNLGVMEFCPNWMALPYCRSRRTRLKRCGCMRRDTWIFCRVLTPPSVFTISVTPRRCGALIWIIASPCSVTLARS